MDEYKHYIRTDANGVVILGFTTGFPEIATPQPGDLLLTGRDGRQFDIELKVMREGGYQLKYKVVDGVMVLRTQQELDAEWSALQSRPKPPTVEERLKITEDWITEQILGGL